MKTLFPTLAPLLLSAACANAAVSFGVNFTVSAADHVSGTNYGTAAWTSSFVAQGNTAPTAGSFATTESGVSVTYSTSTFYQGGTWGTAGQANEGLNLFRRYLDDGDAVAAGASPLLGTQTGSDGVGAVFQINNMSAWLASNNATSYTITLLLSSDASNLTTFRPYTIRSGNLQGTTLGSANGIVGGDGGWDGTIDRSPGTADAGTRGYLTFSGLTADVLTVSGASTGTGRGSIAGFVVTAVPEPSVALLGGLGVLGLLRRRRP